jgi:hypothetical protein
MKGYAITGGAIRTSGVQLFADLDRYELWVHREFAGELTTSSAVNLPMASAKLRLRVVSTGLRSIRRTYSAARVPRTSFTKNFVFFIVSCPAGKFC